MRVALETLGCKLNQAETELLAGQLAEAGHNIVSPHEPADVYVLNTCTVTHIADRKSRHLLRMAHRRNPKAHIIAVGCYAQSDAEEIKEIEGVELVLGNGAKLELKQLIEKFNESDPEEFSSSRSHPNTEEKSRSPGRTRSFVKAQDGCSNFCAYCIVPLTRGHEKSQPSDQVISVIRKRVDRGYQEIVLTGTEIGSYNNSGLQLKGLLECILQETGVKRLRLSSLQPQEITPELIQLWQNSRLCNHFHLSLQSGSNTVLRRMRRRYSTAEYAEKVELIRSESQQAGITTDIIVGFPGETETEFIESFDFCRRMEFARIHVFPFSPRKGTAAFNLPDQIDPLEKKSRVDKMLALADSSSSDFQHRFLNQTQLVLFEQAAGGLSSGFTSNYIKVYAGSKLDLTNRILPVRLTGIKGDGMVGEVETSL